MKDLGKRIRSLRINKDMTQQALASCLSVTKSVISAYENSIRYPSFDVLVQLSNIFNVSTDYLLGCSRGKMIDVSSLHENEIEGIILLVNSLKKKRHSN